MHASCRAPCDAGLPLLQEDPEALDETTLGSHCGASRATLDTLTEARAQRAAMRLEDLGEALWTDTAHWLQWLHSEPAPLGSDSQGQDARGALGRPQGLQMQHLFAMQFARDPPAAIPDH